jgi:D-sedoheptulose 7-phosphate isomerase
VTVESRKVALHIFAREYHHEFLRVMGDLRVTAGNGGPMGLFQGVEAVGELMLRQSASGHKLLFIGNGASAGIASHMAADFLKNGGMRTVSFNDGALLTCIGNDYGYRHVFEEPIRVQADPGDILVAISSSGQSENILRGVEAARKKGCAVVTLSGFDQANPLSSLGDFNFYVPSSKYGPVEIAHQFVIHCILDAILDHQARNKTIEE